MDFMVSNFCEEECGRVFNTANSRPVSGRPSPFLSRQRLISEMETDAENRLPPEMELGNIEYKAKLVSPSISRLEHLITQMKWRLSEGNGEAIYELGVEDDGRMIGLNDDEFDETMRTLRLMVDALSADIVECTVRELMDASEDEDKGPELRRVAEVLIRKVPESQPFIESRLAMLGGGEVGKSTLCGVLTYQALDDGNGKTRLNQFRHPHEVHTGKTSSVCHGMVAFNSKGKTLNYTTSCWSEMVEQATKIVHLLDLAGDQKYLSTTLYGLTRYAPHACCLMVSATAGVTSVTREHLGSAVALSLPLFVVITKRDAVDKERLRLVYDAVSRLIVKAGRAGILRVKRKRDAVGAASLLSSSDGLVPVLSISSRTGDGLKGLRSLLNALPPGITTQRKSSLISLPPLFTVEEFFQVSHVGEVVFGVLAEGTLRIRDRVAVGPGRDGRWRVATVASVRRAKVPVLSVEPGQAVSLSLQPADGSDEPLGLRKGMVLQPESSPRTACLRFHAQLLLLSHAGPKIEKGFEATFFIGGVRQTARVEHIFSDEGSISIEEYASAELRFVTSPEFVRVGTQLLFRHGEKTRGMGEVTDVLEETD